jgi:hypothetical protein
LGTEDGGNVASPLPGTVADWQGNNGPATAGKPLLAEAPKAASPNSRAMAAETMEILLFMIPPAGLWQRTIVEPEKPKLDF